MTSMRLTSTCCVRSGAVCQADAIVQGAELGQRQRTAAIRTASERPAKSLRNWIRARREITPCCVYRRTAPLQVQLLTLLQRILVSFRHPQFYRHTPLAGSRRRLYGFQSSLHHQRHQSIISRQAASRLPPGASRLPKVAPQYISHSLREHPRLEQLGQHVGTEAADVCLELA